MSTYQYQALPDNDAWIRLLHLLPGADFSDLKASLHSVEIQSQPKYEALSYCWGSKENPKKLLLLDGGQEWVLPITANLDSALRRMRYPSKERVLWVDAVCIDQDETKPEKPRQIRIMDKIYKNAQKVLIHLGESEQGDNLAQAVELLRKIHSSTINIPSEGLTAMQWIQASQLPSVNDVRDWEPLKSFFCRPWFWRKWVIQECTLAAELEFICGELSCDWDWMYLVITTIRNKGLGVADFTVVVDDKRAQQLQQGLAQINTIHTFRQGRQKGGRYGLLDLAYNFQTSGATDKRDHLFALLALAADAEDETLNPQYENWTLLQSCVRYAYYFLRKNQNLEVLYYAGMIGDKMLAPSWIPNWYGGKCDFGYEPLEGFWNPKLRLGHHNVAGGTKVCITTSDDSAVLGLKGVVIDKVTKLANEQFPDAQIIRRDKSLILQYRARFLRACCRIVEQLQSYPTGEDVTDVLWRTLMCNTTRSGTIPGPEIKDAYEAWKRLTLRECSSREQLQADWVTWRPFNQVIDVWNVDKVFGLTSEGYVGMFPQYVKKDDVIAVLFGGEFPVVLRPCTNPPTANYELVGQCYVHGIMEPNQLDLQKYPSQDILLGGNFETETSVAT